MSSDNGKEVLTHRKSSICIVWEIEIDIVTFMVHLLAMEFYDNNTTPLSLYNYLFTHYKAPWPHHLIWSLLPKAPRASYYYSLSHLRNWGSEKTSSRCHNNQAVKPRFKIQFPLSSLHYCKHHTSLNHPTQTLCQNTFLKTNSDGIFQCVDLSNIYLSTYPTAWIRKILTYL